MSNHPTQNNPPTPDQLAEWEALCEGATPGPWNADNVCDDGSVHSPTGVVFRPTRSASDPNDARSVEDAEFAAAARTAVPVLLAEVERLQGLNERLCEWNRTFAERTEAAEARVVELEGKVKRLRDVLNWTNEQCPSKCGYAAGKALEGERPIDRIATLEAALLKHGEHDRMICRKVNRTAQERRAMKAVACTCGLDDALNGTDTEQP